MSRLLLSLILLVSLASAQRSPVAIVDVNVIDVVAGQTRPHQTVLIDNGRISGIGSADAVTVPQGTTRVAGQGRFLIPGLWDMHVHLRSDQRNPDVPLVDENAALLDLFLPNGVVGVREMGGDLSQSVLRWRDEIRTGQRIGPRILTAGRKIDQDPPAWSGSLSVKTAAEGRRSGPPDQTGWQ